MEVTLVPTDTLGLANNDSTFIKQAYERSYELNKRDTIYGCKHTNGALKQNWQYTRQDTVYLIDIHLTPQGIIYKDHTTGEIISKEKHEEIKRSE